MFFDTYGNVAGKVRRHAFEALRAVGAKPCAHTELKCPDNYPSLLYPRDETELYTIARTEFDKIPPRVAEFVALLHNSENYEYDSSGCFGDKAINIIPSLQKHFAYKISIENTCIGCALCVRNCANACIEIVDRKAVVTHPERCENCLGCFQICPKHAVGDAKGSL